MSSRIAEPKEASELLRARVAQLRRELTDATKAYRLAVELRDSAKTIPLLRSRSRLMRQLLETQCELLLTLRADTSAADASAADANAPGAEPVPVQR